MSKGDGNSKKIIPKKRLYSVAVLPSDTKLGFKGEF